MGNVGPSAHLEPIELAREPAQKARPTSKVQSETGLKQKAQPTMDNKADSLSSFFLDEWHLRFTSSPRTIRPSSLSSNTRWLTPISSDSTLNGSRTTRRPPSLPSLSSKSHADSLTRTSCRCSCSISRRFLFLQYTSCWEKYSFRLMLLSLGLGSSRIWCICRLLFASKDWSLVLKQWVSCL